MVLTAKEKLSLLLTEEEMPRRTTSAPSTSDSKPPVAPPASKKKPIRNHYDLEHIHSSDFDDENRIFYVDGEPYHRSGLLGHSTSKQNDQRPPSPPAPAEILRMTGADHGRQIPPLGTAASAGESFCPIAALSKLPYKSIRNKDLGQRIASAFFDQSKFWSYTWDICYAWPPKSHFVEPLLLVSKYQVEKLLQTITKTFPNCPSITSIDSHSGIILRFDDPHPDLRPRFLGVSSSQEQFQALKRILPQAGYRPADEMPPTDGPTKEAKNAFFAKVDQGHSLGKAKNKNKAIRQHHTHVVTQDWHSALRQAERFLGLRPPHFKEQAIQGEPWDVEVAREARRLANDHPPPIDPAAPPPYTFNAAPVLIAIDVESYERNPRQITEIGISTLDTLDLTDIPPSTFASAWRSHIRSRHIRIAEHAHLHNTEFVVGDAGGFRFAPSGETGDSEFVYLADAPALIASCFREPFSAPPNHVQRRPEGMGPDEQRTIVLVGHDFSNDMRYLETVGYNVRNLSNLHKGHSVLDTQALFRMMKGEKDPRGLGRILEEIDVLPWGLHNAGNDARYTLEALLGIVVVNAQAREVKCAATGEGKEDENGVEGVEGGVAGLTVGGVTEGKGKGKERDDERGVPL